MDEDLDTLSREELIAQMKRLRAGIRTHRDSTGQDLCWHHPDLWGLLPEKVAPAVAVPPWPGFLRGCVRYRESLDRELPNAPAADIEGSTPILRVRSLPASIDHYVKVLGFGLDWHAEGTIASVSRGGGDLMLCEGDQGNPGSWVWMGVEDVQRLFEEYRAKGASVRHPPTNYPWACEMQIEDPDGHVLRFGSEPKPAQPFGEWLDMCGVRWAMSPGGGWTRVERG